MTRLQAGDPDLVRAWQLLCDISRKESEAIYNRLDIRIAERGESYYNPMLQARSGRRVQAAHGMCLPITLRSKLLQILFKAMTTPSPQHFALPWATHLT